MPWKIALSASADRPGAGTDSLLGLALGFDRSTVLVLGMRADFPVVGLADSGVTSTVLDRLGAARLIVLADDTVDVAHATLIRAWPPDRAQRRRTGDLRGAFSPDGSATALGRFRWDVHDGRHPVQLPFPRPGLHHRRGPDLRRRGRQDNSLVAPARFGSGKLCQEIGRDLTREEWTGYQPTR